MGATFYVLHVDDVGEFAVKNGAGERCLFVFTSQVAVTRFVEALREPTQREFTAIPVDAESLSGLLGEPVPGTALVAVDPPNKTEFGTIRKDDFVEWLRQQ